MVVGEAFFTGRHQRQKTKKARCFRALTLAPFGLPPYTITQTGRHHVPQPVRHRRDGVEPARPAASSGVRVGGGQAGMQEGGRERRRARVMTERRCVCNSGDATDTHGIMMRGACM